MSDIALYLGICMAGYVAAIPLRKVKDKLKWIGLAQTLSVLILVFTMGLRIGANDEIVKNLATKLAVNRTPSLAIRSSFGVDIPL